VGIAQADGHIKDHLEPCTLRERLLGVVLDMLPHVAQRRRLQVDLDETVAAKDPGVAPEVFVDELLPADGFLAGDGPVRLPLAVDPYLVALEDRLAVED